MSVLKSTPRATLPITLEQALESTPAQTSAYHHRHLNPRLAALADLVGLNKRYTRASGVYVWDDCGNRYLDFLSGYATLSLGHNHPRLGEALEMTASMPNLIESLSPLAGALAHNLATLMPGMLERVYFANSGAEVVDASIKLARSATGRTRLVACHNGFHGRTIGALSVVHREEYREPFAPLLADVSFVPFGDTPALAQELRRGDVAGFVVEPIQCEGGIIVPPAGYLAAVRDLCTRYGTLFIADEIQTGLGRTGTLLAVDHEGVVPDVVLLGKTLGGGAMPLSALLTSDAIFRAGKGGTTRTPFHTSTYGGNTRACAVGIAVLDVLLSERLPERAAASGAYLMERLRELQCRQPLIADVRGRGLVVGIELAPATHGVATLLTGGLVNRLAHSYFAGYVIMQLLRKHGIITLNTLHDPNVLRLEPPLNVEREHLDAAVAALDAILGECGGFTRVALRSGPQLVRALRA